MKCRVRSRHHSLVTPVPELEQEKESLRLMSVSIAETLINAMEAKDVYLRGHSQRVAELAGQIAAELALGETVGEDLSVAGRLHDVGKIAMAALQRLKVDIGKQFDLRVYDALFRVITRRLGNGSVQNA